MTSKKQISLEKLITERLILKPIDKNVANDIFENFTKEVIKYMFPSEFKNIDEAFKFIYRMQKNRAELKDFVYSIHLKHNDEFIGCVGLHRLKLEIPELGIWIKISSHGNKYGREAVYALVELAKKLGYNTLKYPVDCKNIASKKIPISLDGKLIKEHEMLETSDGRILDEEIYHIKTMKSAQNIKK